MGGLGTSRYLQVCIIRLDGVIIKKIRDLERPFPRTMSVLSGHFIFFCTGRYDYWGGKRKYRAMARLTMPFNLLLKLLFNDRVIHLSFQLKRRLILNTTTPYS